MMFAECNVLLASKAKKPALQQRAVNNREKKRSGKVFREDASEVTVHKEAAVRMRKLLLFLIIVTFVHVGFV